MAHYPDPKVHFELGKVGKSIRWDRLRAIKVLDYYHNR